MNKIRMILIILLLAITISMAISIVIVTKPANAKMDDAAAPCTPCMTWGQMKACYYQDPPPTCCSCHKFMQM